jgi:hypothetical protein
MSIRYLITCIDNKTEKLPLYSWSSGCSSRRWFSVEGGKGWKRWENGQERLTKIRQK